MSFNTPGILVVQATGRLHYGAARAFHNQGALAALVTDLAVPPILRPIAARHTTARRYNIPLPPCLVYSRNSTGLFYRTAIKFSKPFSATPHIKVAGKLAAYACEVAKQVKPDTIFGFDTQSLDAFRQFKTLGKRLVMEQCVAPRRSQRKVLEHLACHMDDETVRHRLDNLEILEERENEEWALADLIACPSAYVQRELVAAGVNPEKISVVPYGFTPPKGMMMERRQTRTNKPLRAVFVGGVDFRKGIQDLALLAPEFKELINFEIIGNLMIDETTAAGLGANLQLQGKQPFSVVLESMRNADVFVLPSYLEGSATVIYEALSMGLPCIVSHESGSVITHGHDGFLFDAGDLDAIEGILTEITDEPEMLVAMSNAALETAKNFTQELYGERLWSAICKS